MILFPGFISGELKWRQLTIGIAMALMGSSFLALLSRDVTAVPFITAIAARSASGEGGIRDPFRSIVRNQARRKTATPIAIADVKSTKGPVLNELQTTSGSRITKGKKSQTDRLAFGSITTSIS
jgi:hypothetical protein